MSPTLAIAINISLHGKSYLTYSSLNCLAIILKGNQPHRDEPNKCNLSTSYPSLRVLVEVRIFLYYPNMAHTDLLLGVCRLWASFKVTSK